MDKPVVERRGALSFVINVDSLINAIPTDYRDQVLMLMDSQYWRGCNDTRRERRVDYWAFILIAVILGLGAGAMIGMYLTDHGIVCR